MKLGRGEFLFYAVAGYLIMFLSFIYNTIRNKSL